MSFQIPSFIRHSVFYLMLRKTLIGKKILIKKGRVIKEGDVENHQSAAPAIRISFINKAMLKPFVGIVKDGIYFDDYVSPNSSWLYYRRFCVQNDIPYKLIDIKSDSWIDEAKKFDIIFWHPNSKPEDMYIAENLAYILENILNKKCFPSFHEVWQYEDKNRSELLYRSLGLPSVKTFLSHKYDDAKEFIKKTKYPIISKTHIGAGSSGVTLIKDYNHANRFIKKAFGYRGKKTFYPYMRQKDYVFFQEFIEDAKFDLRIIIVGNKAFGYFRYPNKGDFRASGAGNFEKKELPMEAVKLAVTIKNKLKSRLMGVDLMYSEKRKSYFIIETSLFNQIDSPSQLEIDNISGYYDIDDDFKFKPGKFWIAELVAELVISDYIKDQINE